MSRPIFCERLKCDEMQGYLFSPGVASDKVEELLRQKNRFQRSRVSES